MINAKCVLRRVARHDRALQRVDLLSTLADRLGRLRRSRAGETKKNRDDRRTAHRRDYR